MNDSDLRMTRKGGRTRHHLLAVVGGLVIVSFFPQALAARVVSSDEDHIAIFVWVAGKKGNEKARSLAEEHCNGYRKRAKFRNLSENIYTYDCVPRPLEFREPGPPPPPPPTTPGRGGRMVVQDQAGSAVGGYAESNALLIGVSDYTAGWPDLDSVPRELQEVEEVLKDHGFSVTRVLNPGATGLQDAFEDFIDRHGYRENQRLLFFFSGHGYTRTLAGRTKGYLVPADAPDPRRDEEAFQKKALAMSQIVEMARRIEAKHALFLFDSCFSGTVFTTRAWPKPPPQVTAYTLKPVRQFISAGSANEEVPATSVFAPMLVRALQGEGDLTGDGYITGTELGVYLNEKVLFYNQGQTPQFGKIRDPHLDQGDFVFRVRGAGS